MSWTIDKIIASYGASILKICVGYSSSKEESEDLYQDVLINVWKGLNSFKGNSEIKTWLYRIAINTCLLSKRKVKIKTVEFNPIKHKLKESLEIVSHQKNKLDKLLKLIHAMPHKDKSIMLLYLEGLTYNEISDVIGISVSNVGVKINRSKKYLTSKINENG